MRIWPGRPEHENVPILDLYALLSLFFVFPFSSTGLCVDRHKIALSALVPDDLSGCYPLSEIFKNNLPHHARLPHLPSSATNPPKAQHHLASPSALVRDKDEDTIVYCVALFLAEQ